MTDKIKTIEEADSFFMDVKPIRRKQSLERMRKFMALLGNPQDSLKFVHVAGTNGKGSTCAFTASILREAGYRTGLYISPHLDKITERISINGTDIPDEDFIALANELSPVAETMDEYPSVFEMITAAAFLYFKRQSCDIVVLEVGMGGIIDGTNIIDTPETAVITAIGLDHCYILGNTLPEIAQKKAGIIKPGGKVAVYPGEDDVNAVFESAAEERGAELTYADFSRIKVTERSIDGVVLDIEPYKNIRLALLGTYQQYNAVLAVTAAENLIARGWKIVPEAIIRGLENARWPGRFEIISRNPVFILDGSHNPQGIAATVESLKSYFPDKKFIMVMGIMEDKDHREVLRIAAPEAKMLITAAVDYHRALPAMELAREAQSFGVDAQCAGTVREAVNAALSCAQGDDVICAFGSFYIYSEVREAVEKYKEINA